MGDEWTPPVGELVARCGKRFWQVRCGWCGVEVNAYTPHHFDEIPRIGRTGFHNSCWDHFVLSMRTLASNLAAGGALCAAWGEGTDYGHHEAMCVCEAGVDDRTIRQYHWRPGCGHTAPGFDDGKGER